MTSTQLSAETLFDLLQNRQRRYLLYTLDRSTDSTLALAELTERVLDWERRLNGEAEASTAESKLRLRISLHHNHLPKLAEVGLVEYDARSEMVRKEDNIPVAALLEAHQNEVPHLRSLFFSSAMN